MKAEIRKAGGIQILVKLMDNPDPDVKKNCAVALLSCIDDFVNRAEIRYVKGLRPLLELLVSDHTEVQDVGLKCILKCLGDPSNVIELRKLSAVRKVLEYVSILSNESLFEKALQCLYCLIEDSESVQTFVECNGLAPLMRLCSHEMGCIRKQASVCLSRVLSFEKNQAAARESGLIPTTVQQLSSNDPIACSAACILVGALAKNGKTTLIVDQNQTELVKSGAIELLMKHVQSEDKEVQKETLFSLTRFCTSPKNRLKIRVVPDCISSVAKILATDDHQTLINTCDFITAFCEDLQCRQDIIKSGAVNGLVGILEIQDTRVQAASCMALTRLLQETEGQNAVTKQANVLIGTLLEFLQSPDIHLCKIATYLLPISCQVESNAIHACSMGAIELLIQLSKQPAKKVTKFALEALEKLLNYRIFNSPRRYCKVLVNKSFDAE
jgi:hypothetical protein